MSEANNNVWVELVGDVIVARVRGAPNVKVIHECQERVLALLKDTGCRCVLYDALEMDRPSTEVTLAQQEFTPQLLAFSAQIALVVPNTTLAYLARLAFGESNHRVFYNDMAAAFAWLSKKSTQS